MMVIYGFMRYYTYDINMYLKFRKDFIRTQTYIYTHTKKSKYNTVTSGFNLNRMKATLPISSNTI